ncbi:MAG TPA: hypothetical protein VFY19_11945 [Geminicoccaceae bacterium]|nr:hypothetical protein [Geminicoccaceae bacterium]
MTNRSPATPPWWVRTAAIDQGFWFEGERLPLWKPRRACAGALIRPPRGKQFGPDRLPARGRFEQFERIA